jgi:hypothetical protein
MTSEATSDESAATVCWCCGVERGESELARLECAGGQIEAPSDTDYGLREGRHVDPDGNVIRYGSPLPGSDRTPEGVWLLAAGDA